MTKNFQHIVPDGQVPRIPCHAHLTAAVAVIVVFHAGYLLFHLGIVPIENNKKAVFDLKLSGNLPPDE